MLQIAFSTGSFRGIYPFSRKHIYVRTYPLYSVDKMVRLIYGFGWWPDEQPSEEVKRDVERKLDELEWKLDVVLSHTTPLKYEPVEVFLPEIDQSKVDKSTEEWLDGIEDRLDYGKWYCGHYHMDYIMETVEDKSKKEGSE